MKFILAPIALLLSASVLSGAGHAQDEFPVLEGPYLGQKPPSSTAEPFAPGIVNTEEWGDAGGFSRDMNEFYVTRWKHTRDAREPESAIFTRIDNRWHKIVVPTGTRHPFHSPDGKTLRYGKKYRDRTADGWSEMKSLGPAFEEIPIMGLTASTKGTLVFDEFTRDGNGVLRYSKLHGDRREDPKPFGTEINTGKYNAHPFIAPDESYMMWDGERENGYGDNDLYISFRQQDGSWGEAINLGDKVNTEAEEGGPQVTPDGKYLLFNRMVPSTRGDGSRQSDLYWISTQFIDELRHKNAPSSTTGSPYLGQTPPNSTPEPFAPGLVSTERWEYGGVFSPDMREFYLLKDDYNEQTSFVVFRYQDGKWRESVISGRVGQPFISPDGKTLHLGRRYKERTGTGWSDIKNLGGEFEDIRVMRLTASSKGTYYFDEVGTDGDGRIRYSRLVDGKRETPRLASDAINTGTWLAHPFIAPDESYILWDGRKEGGFGSSDIYVSFRQKDGSWGKAINLGNKINTDAWEASASVTPDGKFLFFHRTVSEGNVDIFWVDAQIIEELRHKNENGTINVSPYLGQKPPGSTAEIFAPGIVNTAENREIEGMFAPVLSD